MNSLLKLIGFLVIALGACGVYVAYRDVAPFYFSSQSERLESLWARDLGVLAQTQKLPEAFRQIKEVTMTPLSDKAREWLKDVEYPILTNPNGDHKLEVIIDDWEDNGEIGAMIQYQLIEIKTGNTVWELGRTFNLSANTEEQSK